MMKIMTSLVIGLAVLSKFSFPSARRRVEFARDEDSFFIRGEEPFGYHPELGGYPDLYNHLSHHGCVSRDV
jgi:hypothetical protein